MRNFAKNEKRYLTFNNYFKAMLNEKVLKCSLDGGFTCPNRDGTKNTHGCIFCGEDGAGEFTNPGTLKSQMEQQVSLLSGKWKNGQRIAYFQNFTNTYGDLEKLKKIYNEALSLDKVVGLAIATRGDCLSDEVIEILNEINKKTFLWLELGMQTVKEETISWINRGYTHEIMNEAIDKLRANNIRTLCHVIFGLKNESHEDMKKSIAYVASKKLWGVKIHSLYVQKDSNLYNEFLEKPFRLMEQEEYINLVCDAIEMLYKDTIVHRITGDPPRNLLYAPKWTTDKLNTITKIDRELERRQTYQGYNYQEEN